MKILCTGNPNDMGIAHAVKRVWPNASFVSRTNGYDLSTQEGLDKFKETIAEYDVFVNNSQVVPGTQETLLNITSKVWTTGHVFNIGSVAEYKRWEWFDPLYSAEKRSLRELSLELCNEHFKTTHIVVGGFQDMSPNTEHKMDPINIVNAINWILTSEFDVPLIGIERLADHKNYWKDKQDEATNTQ
jgi:hypothetical protein